MNWTGGRLQRHSYKSHKSQKDAQRNYFAKARQKAQKRPCEGSFSASARSLLSHRLLMVSFCQQEQDIIDSKIEREKQVGETLSTYWASKHGIETEESHSFEQLRRKLLSREDWANLSISRPLRMNIFPRSDQHTANIAKRRRCRKQEMKDRIPSQDEGSDADIAIGTIIDFPRGPLARNHPDVGTSGFAHTKLDEAHITVQGMKITPVRNNNIFSRGENLHQANRFETDMETPRMANSRNLYCTEGSSSLNGFSYTTYHGNRGGAAISAAVGGIKGIWSPNRRSRNSSSPVRSMNIQHRSLRDNLRDELPHDYGSIVGSESSSPSQDRSESMLLDNEDIYIIGPLETESKNRVLYHPQATQANGERDGKYRGDGRNQHMPDTSRVPNIFEELDGNRFSSSTMSPRNINAAELAHSPSHRYIRPGSSSAGNSQASAHGQAPDGKAVSGFRTDLDSDDNYSTKEDAQSVSFEPHNYPSSQDGHEKIECDYPAQREFQDQSPHFPTETTNPDVADASPEDSVSSSREINAINKATDVDEGDYIWKNFIFRPVTSNGSQTPDDDYMLPSPVRVEGSVLATADKPAYPNSLTEPTEASNETGSYLEGSRATAAFDSANLAELGGSDSSGCQVSSRDAVVDTTSDNSSAHHNNVSELGETFDDASVSNDIAIDNGNTDNEAQSAETKDIWAANTTHFNWDSRRDVLASDVIDSFLPRFLEPDTAPSPENFDKFAKTNMYISPWLEPYIKHSR
ncbi:hypothetical protein AJ78_07630 [Emergomyces pasteurianus Ep9510]|uniref:Uncharacterized protein n=1 Tax=Emergomyces pasteurianus Ep9510 TaxID=1447872 RepID=A0A1J9Q6T3_9EURO|nr:hypothetical protein AJ78_07630 [Emergomyces pasteurianus Ep9510]